MTAPEFRESEAPAAREDVPDRELQERLTLEEMERRLVSAVRERGRLLEELATLSDGFRKQRRAWQLAKEVIAERFGPATGNLIRMGIETRVERELGAGPPE